MGRKEGISGRKNEQGIVIALVAVVMLFVVGAMAALSIDVVTLYTARSEAQLAADAGALAGARTLANSGMTSNPFPGLIGSAETLAVTVATQVAANNQVGGRNLNPAGTWPCTVGQEICVSFNDSSTTFGTNPHVTVQVMRADLPTFFARIWGSTQIKVSASATAEAYNPSTAPGALIRSGPPVAPICVKPWLLPNIDPTQTTLTATIFDSTTGAIENADLVGKGWPNAPVTNPNPNGLYAACGDCSTAIPTLTTTPSLLPGQYYPGAIDAADFPAPTQALPTCSTGFNPYQLAVAGCVQQPISCGATANIKIDVNPYVPNNAAGRDADTVQAAECLIHYVSAAGDSDSIDTSAAPSPPFQFLAGNQNPVASAIEKDVVVSDSLVTIPVIDYPGMPIPPSKLNPSVTVIGFLQVFLNPQSTTTLPLPSPPAPGFNQLPVTIINMAGCGNSATGQPILGNGASPVAVRLISP